MKKILGISGIRSDYDLLYSLYRKLNKDKSFELKLIVGNAHLSRTYGSSISNIELDNIDIIAKIESLIDGDSNSSRLKSLSIFLQNSIDVIATYDPDIIIYAGDRFEVIIGSLIGGYLEKPTIHFYGGDHGTDGHIDNPIRHATSKLSTFHFVTIDEHKERLINMGENKERIKVIGSIALDRFIKNKSSTIESFYKDLSVVNPSKKHCLLIYHPPVGEENNCAVNFEIILKTLLEENIFTFVSCPNTDPGNKNILQVIENYKTYKNLYIFKNMKRKDFISLFKNSDFIIGNSSSGILEAASIPIPAINIGTRQKDRFAPKNVIFVDDKHEDIRKAINKVLSSKFKESIRNIINPYGNGKSASMAINLMKKLDINKFLKKTEDPLKVFNV